MDLASDHGSERPEHKYSDPPIGYINSEDEEDELLPDEPAHSSHRPPDGRQTDGALLSQIQSRIQTLLPLLTSTSRAERSPHPGPGPLAYLPSSARDGNARFARAPSNSGHIRHRGGAPHDLPRGLPQRRDSIMTASESSMISAASPSVGFDQRQQSVQSDAPSGFDPRTDAPYRRPGKHRVGESPTPEEYMALPPEAKKKVDNRLSARRSRAKRKEHVHVLTTQIAEQQQVIEMLRIENKQLNDHIANLSRAGYSLHPHPPPFQPGLVPHHPPHPSPHLRHIPPPSHLHASARHLPPVHPTLPPPLPSESPRRSLLVSPTLSTHPSLASSSGLVAAAAPPTGPGQVPILAHHARPEAGSSYPTQGQGPRYDSPGRGTKREVEDERDDRLRSRMRYTSPERADWDRESEGRRGSRSGYQSPPAERRRHSKARELSRSPSPSPSRPPWGGLPPSLAAPQHMSSRLADYDPTEEVGDERAPIQISGKGSVSDRLATLIRVHKRAIITYRATRQGELSKREDHMEGLLGAAEVIGKEVEELTDEFRYVGQNGD
ncbi:bZIP transcription factor [Ceratobasidium sp. AG-Ba]|nr:bZIP transcription factor [Ceratobasidium sp. AG-Ba]QRW05346.1 bZIP transcription factor [Ceratobasidium sp. AG-Ba]